MKTIKNHAGSLTLASLLFAAALAACGGGGDDDAGSPTALSVQPDTVTFTSTSTACASGGTQDVYVYGGTAPYRIDNTIPDYVAVDKAQVDGRGGHFTLTVSAAACIKDGTIVVVDKLDKQVVFTVNNAASGAS